MRAFTWSNSCRLTWFGITCISIEEKSSHACGIETGYLWSMRCSCLLHRISKVRFATHAHTFILKKTNTNWFLQRLLIALSAHNGLITSLNHVYSRMSRNSWFTGLAKFLNLTRLAWKTTNAFMVILNPSKSGQLWTTTDIHIMHVPTTDVHMKSEDLCLTIHGSCHTIHSAHCVSNVISMSNAPYASVQWNI